MQNKFKKIVVNFVLLSVTFLCLVSPVSAQLSGDVYSEQLNIGASASGLDNVGAASGDPRILVGRILKGIVSLLGTIFVAIIVLAGSKYINSDGDSAEVDDAKAKIRMAIVGLILTLASYSIATFLVTKSIESVNNAKPQTGYDQP